MNHLRPSTFENLCKEVERQIPLKSEITSIGGGFIVIDGVAVLARLEEVKSSLDSAHTAMAHALTLGYCGEGSTRGMVLDALRKIEAVLPAVSGGVYEDCGHEYERKRVSGPFDPDEYDNVCKHCGMTEPFNE